MKNYFIFCFVICLLLFFNSCKKKTEPSTTRTFYMGVTPWPADFTQQEVDVAYSFINNHCDIVSHHFDDGISYEEAYNNTNWPTYLVNDLQTRKTKSAGIKIFLSSSALSLSRNPKASYYSYSTNISDSIKNQWTQLAFNDPKVVTAYTNFIIYLTNQLQPSFINYGVESWNSSDFALYKIFLSQVYTKLKTQFPTIPIMISLMVNENSQSLNYASQLMAYTDYLALSAYPYTNVSSSASGNTNPALFPSTYFQNYLNLANGKPFGFAETGYILQDLNVASFSYIHLCYIVISALITSMIDL